MSRRMILILSLMLMCFLAIGLAACGSDEEPTSATETTGSEASTADEPAAEEAEEPAEEVAEEPAVELFGDPIRGGLLYDKWWKPVGADAPEDDHPLWATQSTNERSGGDTWRCKECHGWDYQGADGAYGDGSHFTGFTGVLQWAGGDANEILSTLMGSTSSDHDFSTVMDEQALTDLALFMSEEMIDYGPFIDGEKMAVGGDAAMGGDLYLETCSECHGPEGLAINFSSDVSDPDYVAAIANGNPWEFFHKMRFGQPGEPDMAAAVDIGWSEEEQLAVLAFAQSLPNSNPVTQGGLLYDKWWNALGIDEPEGDQPLWATQDTNERSGADTWRCKECHGWDYQGSEGAYAEGSHFTGFTGIAAAYSMSTEELVAWLNGTTNPDHDFSGVMDEAVLEMLAAFMQEGQVDMTMYINDDKTVNGDTAHGEQLYNAGCARCHGDDGHELNFGDDAEPEYVSDLASGNPWEILHKAAYGQPGKDMPSGINYGWSWQDLADLLAYLQTLPGAE